MSFGLSGINAARGHHYGHRHHGHFGHHNRTDGERKPLHLGLKIVVHKLVGGAVAAGTGFVDTYSGMPAFGADASGKGGIGIDTIGTGLINAAELGYAIWKGQRLGHGTILEPIVTGITDGSWFGYARKFGEVTGAAKRAGAEANVGGDVDYEDDGEADNSRNGGHQQVVREVVYDPMHGMR